VIGLVQVAVQVGETAQPAESVSCHRRDPGLAGAVLADQKHDDRLNLRDWRGQRTRADHFAALTARELRKRTGSGSPSIRIGRVRMVGR